MYWTVRSRLNALVAAEGATLTAGRTILAAIVQYGRLDRSAGEGERVWMFWLLRCGVVEAELEAPGRRAEVLFFFFS